MMHREYDELLTKLGVSIELHDQLVSSMEQAFSRSVLQQKNRPLQMAFFDAAYHDSHFGRVQLLYDFRKAGGKSIGTFCIYVPEEIALAAGVETFALCGGSSWSLNYADSLLPRDICPLIRSTIGMAVSNTCPYKKVKDFAVGETTCDAKKKTWDLIGAKVLEIPQKKGVIDQNLWLSEVMLFKRMMEELSGREITFHSLKEAIRLMNQKRLILKKINEFRTSDDPVISGLDALLISQIALNCSIHSFIDAGQRLIAELQQRADHHICAYERGGARILLAGTPAPLGFMKVHHIAESSGLRIVADESCTGVRYWRDTIDETCADTIDGLIAAVAQRYFQIDCPCFSPNKERIENIKSMVKQYKVSGVIQSILMYCHGYNVEAKIVENALAKEKIPSLKIVTDYSDEDREQLKVRIESFAEILNNLY
ncbi:MAG: 2-hydroxyacyl-CoA dehydratase [Chitinivibrionales bacterium]|nr:2-hydroxyacyl-CoA dehydratase [Chitinivibrionales bacterium]